MNKMFFVTTIFIAACGQPDTGDTTKLCTSADGLCQVESQAATPAKASTKTMPKSNTEHTTAVPDRYETDDDPRHKSSVENTKQRDKTGTIKTETAPKKTTNKRDETSKSTDQKTNVRDETIIIDEEEDEEDDKTVDLTLPPFIAIDDVVYAGTGCPDGSADLTYLHDGKTFELNTGDLFAEAAPDTPRRDRRRACQVLFAIDHTPGWQYAIDVVLLSVHAELNEETIGSVKISSYIQGEPDTEDVTFDISGPIFDSLDLDASPAGAWSPCAGDRALNLKVDAKIHGGEEPFGLIEVGNPIEIRLQWRECVSD